MKTKVAVWPAGTEIGAEVVAGLAGQRHFVVIGAGTEEGRGDDRCRNVRTMPIVGRWGWLDEVDKLLADVDILYPAHDAVAYALARIPVDYDKVISVGRNATVMLRSKSATYRILSDIVPVPRSFHHSDVKESDLPVFVKPDMGQGSQGAGVAETLSDLYRLRQLAIDKSGNGEAVITELMVGAEFTIDCFSVKGELRWCMPRVRTATRNGISVNTSAIGMDAGFDKYARAISERLEMNGAWFFQMRNSEPIRHSPVLMEVGTRIAGGAGLARARGVNLPLLTVWNHLGKDIQISENGWPQMMTRPLTNRYNPLHPTFTHLYMDLDDTLLYANGTVNPWMMALLAQCRNQMKAAIILTRTPRHEAMPRLRGMGLGEWVTDLYHVPHDENKSAYINNNVKSVFVDDSFKERSEVRRALPATCMAMDAPTAAELLLERRVG